MTKTYLELHRRLIRSEAIMLCSTYEKKKCGLCGTEFKGYCMGDVLHVFSFYFEELRFNNKGIDTMGEYTPIRQNIVLLCAAINGEL